MHLIIPSECHLRVFVTAKQEIFEFFDNAKHMLHRHTFSYGESIIQLLEIWKETDEPLLQEAYEYLKNRAQVGEENMGEWNEILFRFQHVDNPFLYLLVMQLAPLLLKCFYDIDPAIVTEFREELDKVRADAHTLLYDCLNPETADICRRYWEIWGRTPMRLPSIRTELLPARTRAAYNGWISPAENTDPEYLYSTQQEMILAEVCYPRSVQELYVFLKSTYLRRAVRFKECRLCGKLFAATDGDRTEYCSREYEKGKTCREVGASRVYQKKLLGNPITRAYNRAYKTHNARIRYGTMTREEFNAWTEEAKKHRDACQAGEISLERFEEWLKQ